MSEQSPFRSKVEDYPAPGLTCSECEDPVYLHKGDYGLNVKCGCADRSVKVSKVLPDGWLDG